MPGTPSSGGGPGTGGPGTSGQSNSGRSNSGPPGDGTAADGPSVGGPSVTVPRGRAHPGDGRGHAWLRIRDERAVLSRTRSGQDRAADAITRFAGSLVFVYLHAVWFAGWILVNEGVLGDAVVFDRFPFGLLTMIVSLEAIFLSTFVMISQNRESARQDVRAELDFETNLRSVVWAAQIGRALGIDPHEVERKVREEVTRARAEIAAGGSAGAPGAPDPHTRG
ncbi:DUF1003 domain-containing protein [Frankia sp. AiPa1]|nr:DUF1003 domain-containing protein [Frankia sp. AiPa1]